MSDFRLDVPAHAHVPDAFDDLSAAAMRRPEINLRGAWKASGGEESLVVAGPSQEVVMAFIQGVGIDVDSVAQVSLDQGDDRRPLFPGAKVYCPGCRIYHTPPVCG